MTDDPLVAALDAVLGPPRDQRIRTDPVVQEVLEQFRDEANLRRVPLPELLALELAKTCAELAAVRAQLVRLTGDTP